MTGTNDLSGSKTKIFYPRDAGDSRIDYMETAKFRLWEGNAFTIIFEPMIAALLYFYGTFLILCGIVSVLLIGLKAKTALASGGTAGTVIIITAYLLSQGTAGAAIAGIVISLALFCVFSWRSAKTLFKIFELIPASHKDLNGKGIAFLIISLMAIVSLLTLIIQVIHLR